MVSITEVNTSNQSKGNKRKFSNSKIPNARGGQELNSPAKLQKSNVGSPRNVHKGGIQNANKKQNITPSPNKSQQKNRKSQQNVEEDDDEQPEQLNDMLDASDDESSNASEEGSSIGSDIEAADQAAEEAESDNEDDSGNEKDEAESEDEDDSETLGYKEIDDSDASDGEVEQVESKTKKVDKKIKTENLDKSKDGKKPNDPELDGRTIYVGCLPKETGSTEIHELFQKYGKMQSVEVTNNKHKETVAWIVFKKRKAAVKALELNGLEYQQCNLRVYTKQYEIKHDSNTTIFVAKIPKDINRGDLWTTFQNLYGPIKDIRLPMKNGQPRQSSFAFIEFQSSDSKEKALQKETVSVKNQSLQVQEFVPKERKAGEQTRKPYPKSNEGQRKNFKKGPGNFSGRFQGQGQKNKGGYQKNNQRFFKNKE